MEIIEKKIYIDGALIETKFSYQKIFKIKRKVSDFIEIVKKLLENKGSIFLELNCNH